jgi:hypothetical protein
VRWEGLHIGIFACILILPSNKESGGYLSEVLPLFAWGHVFNLFSLHFNIGLPVHQVSQHCDCARRAKVIIFFPNDHLYRAFKTTECCPALFHNLEKREGFFLEIFFFKKYLFLVVLGPRCSLRAFSSCSEREQLFSCGVWASHYRGFSCCGT